MIVQTQKVSSQEDINCMLVNSLLEQVAVLTQMALDPPLPEEDRQQNDVRQKNTDLEIENRSWRSAVEDCRAANTALVEENRRLREQNATLLNERKNASSSEPVKVYGINQALGKGTN